MTKKGTSAWDMVCFQKPKCIGLPAHYHETWQTASWLEHGNGTTAKAITGQCQTSTQHCTCLKQGLRLAAAQGGKVSGRKKPQRTVPSCCSPAVGKLDLSPLPAGEMVQNMNLRSKSTLTSTLTSEPTAPVKSYSYHRVNYVLVTQRAHMAPLEGNRDTTASSKAYVHLSPTPTQKHKVQNMFHAHIIVTATAEHSLLPGGAGGLQTLSP